MGSSRRSYLGQYYTKSTVSGCPGRCGRESAGAATIAGERRMPAPSPCEARVRNKGTGAFRSAFSFAPEGFGRLLSCAVLGYFGGPFSFRGASASRKALSADPRLQVRFRSGASAGGSHGGRPVLPILKTNKPENDFASDELEHGEVVSRRRVSGACGLHCGPSRTTAAMHMGCRPGTPIRRAAVMGVENGRKIHRFWPTIGTSRMTC